MMEVASSGSKGRKTLVFLLLIVAIATYLFLTKQSAATTEVASAAAPPAPLVEVTVIASSPTRIWSRFSGRLTAVDSAEIKPLVGGRIQQVFFEDGQLVQKGDPLFLIDPRPFEAVVKRIEAQLSSAQSTNRLAKQELERTRGLVNKKLISDSLFDVANSEYEVSVAAISQAKSALIEAQLDVEYATITAPFDGRMSRAELTAGNIVEAINNAPVLASLVADKQLYAEFNVDEQSYIRAVRSSGDLKKMPVELSLTGDDKVYQGHIHSFDNQLDSSTGTIRARAVFENSDGILKPGMYADVRLGTANETEVILIPQRAIGTNQAKKFVFVVTADNTVAYREVVLGQQVGEKRVVVTGLQLGEQVIINGLAKIRPGMAVQVSQPEISASPVQ